jgi:small subunit ribosomal protein S1
MTESFAELFEASQANLAKLKPGAIVSGTVVEVRGDVVVINAGLKSEGIVPIEQFRNDAGEIDVAEGDIVKVALDSIENGFGETVLSREKAKRAMVWDELEEALEKNETITGRISGKVKGGLTVDIKASAPSCRVRWSMCARCAIRPTGRQELEFKLIKLDRKRNNVVVSRRAVVGSEHSEEREQLMESCRKARSQGCRQEPHRLRCVRGPGRHRRPAAHHRHGVEARASPVRSRERRRRAHAAC